MTWQDPYYLWLLIVIPLLIAGVWWYRRRSRKQREGYFKQRLFEKLWHNFWPLGSRLKRACLYAGLALLIVGLAGPKVGTQVKQVKRKGVDLLIALDLSASMNAEDVKPSRLKKAKHEINRLVNRINGHRIGLIVFTGSAYLQSPMTLDYSAFRLFLNIAKTNQMPNSATNFKAAMQMASKSFKDLSSGGDKDSNKASKVLLIISDGGNHGEPYSKALKKLDKQGILVYTIGIGTTAGGTIPVYNQSGNLTGYKRNKEGNIVTTKLHPKVLENIAQKGNGKYYAIQSGQGGIDAFLARLDKLQEGVFSSKKYAEYKNQYQWLAGIGLAFLAISLVVPVYKSS